MKTNSLLAMVSAVFLTNSAEADVSESVFGDYRNFWIHESRNRFSSGPESLWVDFGDYRAIRSSEAYPQDEFLEWLIGSHSRPVLVKPAIDIRQVKWRVPQFILSSHTPCSSCMFRHKLAIDVSIRLSQFDKLQNLPIYKWTYLISLHSLFMNELDMEIPVDYSYFIDLQCRGEQTKKIASYTLVEERLTKNLAAYQEWTYDNVEAATVRKSDYEHFLQLCKAQGGSYLTTFLSMRYDPILAPTVWGELGVKMQFLGMKIQEIVEP